MPSKPSHLNASGLAVVVMGVSGSGKSTMGKEFARQLGCAFLEGDEFHSRENVEKMRQGTALTDEDRWPWLDRLATAIGEEAARNGLAVASCSSLRRVYRERISASARCPVAFVLLDVPKAELEQRMIERPGHYMPPSLLQSQLATLERPGADECVLTIGAKKDPGELSQIAIEWLLSTGHIRPPATSMTGG